MALLEFDNVSLEFPHPSPKNQSLRNHIVSYAVGGKIAKATKHTITVRALSQLNFRIKDGDAIGLVGHNGAGKSTLLRTMAGIYTPTIGTIHTEGRIATVLEIGSGIEPELSGYENIYRLGIFQNLKKSQIEPHLADIIAFTDLGDFMHLPVRTYSSGMVMRLMFAVATASPPDILLLDEMFGVGDKDFREKSSQRIHNMIKNAKIFIFASHNKTLINTYCNRIFSLQQGALEEIDKKQWISQ